ncbi:MAG: formylmethanofuran--tetrahydromethanopterin N-formyltransferase [Promethearchaeota archaeon]
MELNGVPIEDTFCEAFGTFFSRVLVTAKNEKWLRTCASVTTGFATSTIHCPCEAGIDVFVPPGETPDGRPGVVLMFCVSDKKKVDSVLLDRLGQCVLTTPTTACFDAMGESVDPAKAFEVKTGYKLKFFGDKYEEKAEGLPFDAWKIPVMDGEFLVQSTFKVGKGIAGGNFLIIGESQDAALEAAEKAVEALSVVPNLIAPFPGGIARSGSKVGSQYSFLNASTNHPLCPTLRGKVTDSELKDDEACVYEVILDGATEAAIKEGMKLGVEAAVKVPGVKRISAGNYGGKLGKFQYRLHDLF